MDCTITIQYNITFVDLLPEFDTVPLEATTTTMLKAEF